jgi:nucleoside-diphosphate-sugar epimerase
MALTIFGGKGFIGGHYVDAYYHHAIGNIASVNARSDYKPHSADVLYFISTTDNQNVYKNPLLDINTNLVTLVKVLENWRLREDAADGVFNFISSWFVNSEVKGFYTSTKRCAEELLEAYCKAFGLRYRIVRLPNVVGPRDRTVSEKKNALQYVISQIANDKEVVLRPVLREYMHVEDCVRAIDTVLCKGGTNTVYNLGTGELINFEDAASYCAKALKSKSTIVRMAGGDNAKPTDIKELLSLGYVPKYTTKTMLDDLVAGARNENTHSRHQR